MPDCNDEYAAWCEDVFGALRQAFPALAWEVTKDGHLWGRTRRGDVLLRAYNYEVALLDLEARNQFDTGAEAVAWAKAVLAEHVAWLKANLVVEPYG